MEEPLKGVNVDTEGGAASVSILVLMEEPLKEENDVLAAFAKE